MILGDNNFHPFQFLSVTSTIFYIITVIFIEWISWQAFKGTLFLLILEGIVVTLTLASIALFTAMKLWAQFRSDVSGTILPKKAVTRRTSISTRKKTEEK